MHNKQCLTWLIGTTEYITQIHVRAAPLTDWQHLVARSRNITCLKTYSLTHLGKSIPRKRGALPETTLWATPCLLNCPLQHSMTVAEGVSQFVQLPIVRIIIHDDEVVGFAECESIQTLYHGRGGICWG